MLYSNVIFLYKTFNQLNLQQARYNIGQQVWFNNQTDLQLFLL